MSETAAVQATRGEDAQASTKGQVIAFSFGDAESVLDRRELLYHMESWLNGRWYEPPVSLKSLARLLRVSAHHSSAIMVKRNLLVRQFRPSKLLSRTEFGKFVLDYLVMGNAYLERVDNVLGRPMALRNALALNTRRGVEEGAYFFLPGGVQGWGGHFGNVHEFARGSVFHLLEPDVSQEIYGVPEYLSALQSSLLNEAATLFRRRYYLNGSHAGFIFYLSEANVNAESADQISETLNSTKGMGNFRNLFLHVPGGKKDGVQIIPISEVAAKDGFLDLKNVTRDDILAAERVPPQLLGVVPTNSGGFGDVGKAANVFFRNEIEPIQWRMLDLNDWLGSEAIAFDPYEPVESGVAAAG